MTAERERLLQKIKRVQALAERGVGGEKESAAVMLDRLMEQYGISEAEISEDRREMAWFRFKTDLERRLLLQVMFAVMGGAEIYDRTNGHSNRKHKVVGCECTAAERLEIELSNEFYQRAMNEELERFIHAFVCKNGIFPPPDKADASGKPPSPEELAKLQAMMKGMDEHTRRKMLESGAAV